MSNITKQQKQQYMEQLKELKTVITKATEARELRNQVDSLETKLHEMAAGADGDIKLTLQSALDAIQKFWLHDTTRFQICRWVQTLISQLNRQ